MPGKPKLQGYYLLATLKKHQKAILPLDGLTKRLSLKIEGGKNRIL